MDTTIALSLCHNFRLVEEAFGNETFYRVEKQGISSRRWKVLHRVLNRKIAVIEFEGAIRG